MIWSKTFFIFLLLMLALIASSHSYQSLASRCNRKPPGLGRRRVYSSAVSSISNSDVVLSTVWEAARRSQKLCPTLLEQSLRVVLLCTLPMSRSCWRAERSLVVSDWRPLPFSSLVSEPSISSLTKAIFSMKKLLFVGRHIETQIQRCIFFLGVASDVTFNFQNSIQLPFCAPALHPETETPS